MSGATWNTVALRDITSKVGSGATPTGGKEAYHDSGVPLIRSQNVHFDGFRDEGLVFIDESQAASLDNAIVRANDVLLNITGASIGRVTLAPPRMEGARVNQHVTIVRTKPDLSPSFLRWYLASPDQQHLISSVQVGVTRQALTKQMVLDFQIPIPSPSEQDRIVAKIDELFSDLDAGVAALERARANLKRYRASLLKSAVDGSLTADWRARHPETEPASKLLERILSERREKWEADQLAKFTAAGKAPPKAWRDKYVEPPEPEQTASSAIPETWCLATAEQLCDQITDGEHNQPRYTDSGKPMLTATHVRDGHVDPTDAKLIAAADFAKARKRCGPQTGDVLVVCVGATTGRAAIVEEFYDFALVRSVLLLRPSRAVDGRFVLTSVQAPELRRWIGAASGASAQAHFYISDAKRMTLALAPLDEQLEIVAEVSAKLSQIGAAETEIDHALHRAARLRQAILKQAFTGKLVPQNSNDEPAATLLERAQTSTDKSATLAPKRRKKSTSSF